MRQRKPRRVALDLDGLIGATDILRLPGGVRRDPNVDDWLSNDSTELRSIAINWFARMRQCGDDVVELLHDGGSVACVGDAPFGYVNAFKSHVNVGFFHGAALEDPAGLLEGSGKHMRHVKLRVGTQANTAALDELIYAAYLDIEVRVR